MRLQFLNFFRNQPDKFAFTTRYDTKSHAATARLSRLQPYGFLYVKTCRQAAVSIYT